MTQQLDSPSPRKCHLARAEEGKCGIMDVSETTFYLTALQGKRIQICNERNANVDPLKLLDSNVFQVVLSKLRAIDLARCFLVCRDWKACAEEDYLWDSHCLDLWQGKDISSNIHCLGNPKWRFYSTSICESRRTIITLDELCSNTWRFRFKKDIGEYWRSYDPYWQGLPSMQRFFHRDGFVSAGPHDRVWGGHECQWKFASANAKAGQFVRINCWPPLVVSRTPKWGWKMENCYAIYSSEDFEAY